MCLQDIKMFINGTSIQRAGLAMPWYSITVIFSIVVAIRAVGGMIGGFSAGYIIEVLGR